MPSICGKKDFRGPAVRCWQYWSWFGLKQKQTCWREQRRDAEELPLNFIRALLWRRTHEHTLHHLTLNFSQTFRAKASSQQTEVRLQAPPTLTNKTVTSSELARLAAPLWHKWWWKTMFAVVRSGFSAAADWTCLSLTPELTLVWNSSSHVSQFSCEMKSWFYCGAASLLLSKSLNIFDHNVWWPAVLLWLSY